MAQIDIGKFEKVFSSIEKQMTMQSSFLESIYNIQVGQIEVEKERAKDQRRMMDILSVTRDKPEESVVSALKETSPTEVTEEASNGISKFLGLTLSALGSLSFSGIASILLKGGLALAIAKPLGSFVEGIVTQSLEGLMLDDGVSSIVGEAIGSAVQWATIGRIFGKKFALLFGVGGALGETIGNIIGANEDNIYNAFGMAFSQQDIITVGTILGTVFGPSLIKSALANEVVDNVNDASKAQLKPGIKSSFMKGFKGIGKGLGWGLAIAGIGELLAIAITNATGSESLGDVTSWTANGIALGSMFGPTGMLIGGIAGFAIGAGFAINDYAEKRAQEAYDDAARKIDELSNKINIAVKSGDVDAAVSAANEALTNYRSIIETNGVESLSLDELSKKEENLSSALLALQQLDEDAYNLVAQQAEDLRAQISFSKGVGKASPLEEYGLNVLRSELTPSQISNLDEDALKSIIEQTLQQSTISVDNPTMDNVTQAIYDALTTSVVTRRIDENSLPNADIINYRSDNALIEKVRRLEESIVTSGSIASGPVVVNNGGNTTKGGNIYNDNRQTINMLTNAAEALSSYNQFNLAGAQ